MKRMLSLVLLVCMLMGCASASAAINPPASTFASDYFISYGTTLSDNGGHVMHILFSTAGMGMCDVLGVATYRVEKLVTLDDGNTIWASVTEDLPGKTGTNVPSYSYAINFQGKAEETYRVKCTFICTKTFSDGTHGTETKSHTSRSIKIK